MNVNSDITHRIDSTNLYSGNKTLLSSNSNPMINSHPNRPIYGSIPFDNRVLHSPVEADYDFDMVQKDILN